MILFLLACTPGPPDPWHDIPLTRGVRPAWGPDLALSEGVTTRSDGHRYASRVAYPPLDAGTGKSMVEARDGVWTARVVPEEGPVRTWELTIFGEPERIHGTPVVLAPNKAEVVAIPEPAIVRGVIDVGGNAYGFRCLGADADLSPDGWCLAFFSRVWVERWDG